MICWRINPSQCLYESLNLAGDIFSSNANNINSLNITTNDKLVCIASGTARKKGILGIWQVKAKPARYCLEQDCYLNPKLRSGLQWRVAATLIKSVDKPNLNLLHEYGFAKILNRQTPVRLNLEQQETINKICNLYGKDVNIKSIYDDKTFEENIDQNNKENIDKVIEENKLTPTTETKLTSNKYIKQRIPRGLRRLVWNLHFDTDKGKCFCCHIPINYIDDYQCGHIEAEYNGGKLEESNLRPLCKSCNSKMGIQNMYIYMINTNAIGLHTLYTYTEDEKLNEILSNIAELLNIRFTRNNYQKIINELSKYTINE